MTNVDNLRLINLLFYENKLVDFDLFPGLFEHLNIVFTFNKY